MLHEYIYLLFQRNFLQVIRKFLEVLPKFNGSSGMLLEMKKFHNTSPVSLEYRLEDRSGYILLYKINSFIRLQHTH